MPESQKVALVTGASTGIGAAAAFALAGAGFAVVGTSRDSSQLMDRDGVTFVDLDVASDESVAAAVTQVIDRFGRIDVVVNNAGIGASGAAEENSVQQIQRVIDINFMGTVRVMKAVLAPMRSNGGGRIINISSALGFIPAPFMASYSASKHAIEGYSESVDHEVRQYGVRVLIVEPGYTSTSFDTKALPPDEPLQVYAAQRHTFDGIIAAAMKDGDDPAVVAKTIVAAATDRSPKLRYPAGSVTGRVSKLRRFVPVGAFDKQIRKLNKLPA